MLLLSHPMCLHHPSYAAQSCETVSVCIKGSFAAMQCSCSCAKKKKTFSVVGFTVNILCRTRPVAFQVEAHILGETTESSCSVYQPLSGWRLNSQHATWWSVQVSPAGVRAPAGFRCRCPATASRPHFLKEASKNGKLLSQTFGGSHLKNVTSLYQT